MVANRLSAYGQLVHRPHWDADIFISKDGRVCVEVCVREGINARRRGIVK